MLLDTGHGRMCARIGAYALLAQALDSLGIEPAIRKRMRDDVLDLYDRMVEIMPNAEPDETLAALLQREHPNDVEYIREGFALIAVAMQDSTLGGRPGYIAGLAVLFGVALTR